MTNKFPFYFNTNTMQLSFTKAKNFRFLSLFFFGMVVSATSFGQYLLEESFETAVPPNAPAGWTTSYTGNANWQSLDAMGYEGNQYDGNICMFLQGSYYGDQSNAWLISPKFSFTAGKKYSISFYYKNQSYLSNELEATLGTDATPGSQTEIIWADTFKTDYYRKAQINYTAAASGTRYFGLHAITPKTYTYIYVDKIVIQEVSCFEPLTPAVQLSGVTTQSARVTWNTTEDASAYEYGVSESGTIPPSTLYTTHINTALLKGLTAAKKYYLYVRSKCSGSSNSNWAIKDFGTAYDSSKVETLSCGKLFSNLFVGGNGLFLNVMCDEVYFGNEFFHKFVPEQSGYYNLVLNSVNDGQTVEFAYKEATGSLNAAGWNCIGNSNYSWKNSFGPLEAGKTYYILEKTKRPVTLPTSYSYIIECYNKPPAYDSCQNALTLYSRPYSDSVIGPRLTTVGATASTFRDSYKSCGLYEGSGDDDIWIKFTATNDAQIFRFSNVHYAGLYGYGLGINIYTSPCDTKTLVDCGQMYIDEGGSTTIYSYKLHKGTTYYCRFNTLSYSNYANFNLAIMDLDVTDGTANACKQGIASVINKYTDGNNTKEWIPLTDESYKMIGAVYANRNELNNVTASVYVNNGPLRKAGTGKYYLDRNITIQSETAPTFPLMVRLYISNDELNKLIAQQGSGVSSIDDLRITQNDDVCAAAFTSAPTALIKPFNSGDYDADHKFVEFKVNSLSSFYLHGSYTLTGSLQASQVANANTSSAIKANSKISIAPNPFTETINITTNETTAAKYTISIIDMNGHVVKTFIHNATAGFNQFTLNAGNLHAGIYVLKMEKPGSTKYEKIIKQ